MISVTVGKTCRHQLLTEVTENKLICFHKELHYFREAAASIVYFIKFWVKNFQFVKRLATCVKQFWFRYLSPKGKRWDTLVFSDYHCIEDSEGFSGLVLILNGMFIQYAVDLCRITDLALIHCSEKCNDLGVSKPQL